MVTNNYSLENISRPEDKQKSRIGAGIFCVLLLFLLLWPWFKMEYPLPEPPGVIADLGEEGRMASFGNVEVAGGDAEKPNEKPAEEKPVEEEPEPQTDEEVETSDDNEAPRVNTSEEKPTTSTNEAPKKPAHRPVNTGALFGGGKGTGQGAGTQGRPDGKGDLGGTGRGKNGFGEDDLGSRELVSKCKDYKTGSASWSESGKAVFEICVDASGRVISSKFVRKGSTITSEKLVAFIKGCSMQYKYEPKSGAATQCGKITIRLGLN